MMPHLFQWGGRDGRRFYVYLYYNATMAAEGFDNLSKKLVICKGELDQEVSVDAHKPLCKRFFTVNRTPNLELSVSYNDAEIQKYRKHYAGFFCMLTNVMTDSWELVDIYRKRDVVENCFDDL